MSNIQQQVPLQKLQVIMCYAASLLVFVCIKIVARRAGVESFTADNEFQINDNKIPLDNKFQITMNSNSQFEIGRKG